MKQLSTHQSAAVRGSSFYAIFFAVMGIYFAYFNVALVQRGFTGVQIGVFSSLSSVIILIASPLLTALADRHAWHRQMLFWGTIGFAASLVGLHYAESFEAMLPFMATAALANAPVNALADTLAIRMSNHYDLDFGRMRVWGSVGFTVLCVLSGFLWDVIGLRSLFLVGAIVFVVRAFSAYLLDAVPPEASVAGTAKLRANLLAPLKDKFFLLFLVAIFLWGSASSGFFTYASIYMDQLSTSSVLIGLMMALPALGEVPMMLIGDHISRRFGHLRMLIVGFAGFTVIIFLTLFIHDPILLVIINGLRGLGYGLAIIVSVRFVDLQAPASLKGTYQNLYGMAFFTVPALVFMPLLGYIYDTFPIQYVFIISGVIGIAAILLLVWMQRGLQRSSAQ